MANRKTNMKSARRDSGHLSRIVVPLSLARLRKQREKILAIAAQHGARKIRVFGSVARGEADARSDVDFLVDLDPDRNLLDLGGLLMDLRDLLGRPVDVVTQRSLRQRIRRRVIKEAVPL